MKKLVIFAIALVAALIGMNWVRVNEPTQNALKYRDSFDALGYYQYGVNPKTIVFDLRDVGPRASAADVMGGFLDFADEFSDREFKNVILAYKGTQKFILSGRDFKMLGITRSTENPVYLLRTFPEKLRTMDGQRAYGSWTGGMIGVLGAQMDDLNKMADEWFRDEARTAFRS